LGQVFIDNHHVRGKAVEDTAQRSDVEESDGGAENSLKKLQVQFG
jgi:hypothetical protein